MGRSHGRKTVVALAGVTLALATGWVGVSVIGAANAAQNDPHPLALQRVQNDQGTQLVGSVLITDDANNDRWCVNLTGGQGSWTDAPSNVRVLEGHSYNVIGWDGQNCTGRGYGQLNSANADVPVGLSSDKFWYTPNFPA